MKHLLDIITKKQNAVIVIGYAIVACTLIIRWNELDMMQRLGYFLFLTLCLHQLEEYCFPGGFLVGFNSVVPSDNIYSWPGNRLSAGVCNIAAQCFGVCLTIFSLTPQVICGFALFGLLEVVTHTVSGFKVKKQFFSKGMKSIYNPGAATSWLIFLPLGIATLYHLFTSKVVVISDLKWIIACVFAFAICFIGMPTLIFKDKENEYVYNVRSGYYEKYLE